MSILHPHPLFRVHETDAGLDVELSSPRKPVTVVLLGSWLAAWVVGLGFVTQQLVEGDGAGRDWVFLLGWSALWLAAGVTAAGFLAWLLAGAERITLTSRTLRIRRSVWRVSVTHTYPLAEVHELRTFGREIAPVMSAWLDLAGRGASGVRFRCRGRIVRCARALDEPAAHALVEALRAHHAFPDTPSRPQAPAA